MSQERIERRLEAILFADVVGYSRLTGRDEVGTWLRLQNVLRNVVGPNVKAHAGRIIRIKGDGILVEFTSAVEAVASAVALQQAMAERNTILADAQRIELRIGINLGDVITSSDDIHGDGVNIACRLEPLAEPGGICISATVHEHVHAKLPYPFENRGEAALKNIASPVGIYALRPESIVSLPRNQLQPDMQKALAPIRGCPCNRIFVRGRAVGVSWSARTNHRGANSFIQYSRHIRPRTQSSDQRAATIDRGAAVHQCGPRSGARILRRRNDRGLDHRSIADSQARS